jgi:hypothetical protein
MQYEYALAVDVQNNWIYASSPRPPTPELLNGARDFPDRSAQSHSSLQARLVCCPMLAAGMSAGLALPVFVVAPYAQDVPM